MALISKIVVSSTVFVANLISLEIHVDRLNVLLKFLQQWGCMLL